MRIQEAGRADIYTGWFAYLKLLAPTSPILKRSRSHFNRQSKYNFYRLLRT